jgi:CHAT domain-containing protein
MMRVRLLIILTTFFWGISHAQKIPEKGSLRQQSRASYLKDSLRIHELMDSTWIWYHYRKMDLYRQASMEMMAISKKWMAQDSFFVQAHLMGEAGYAQSYCIEGYYKDWLDKYENCLERGLNISAIQNNAFFFRLSTGWAGLGFEYTELGDHEKALEAHLTSFKLISELYQSKKVSTEYYVACMRNLAYAYRALGQYELSEQMFLEGIRLSKANHEWGQIFFQTSHLIGLYLELSLLDKAKIWIDSLAIYLETENEAIAQSLPGFKGKWLCYKAELSIKEGNLTEAKSLLPKAGTPLKTAVGAFSARDVANLYYTMGDWEQAMFFTSMAQHKLSAQSSGQSDVFFNLKFMEIAILLELGQTEESIAAIDTVIELYIKDWKGHERIAEAATENWPNNPHLLEAFSYLLQANYQSWQSVPSAALQEQILHTAHIAKHMLQQQMLTYSSTDFSKSKMFRQFDQIYEIPIQLLMQSYQNTGDTDLLREIFDLIEHSKATQLLAAIKERRVQQKLGIPDHLIDEEKELRKQIGMYKRLLEQCYLKGVPDKKLEQAYHEHLMVLQQEYTTVLKVLKSDYPSYYQLKHNLETIKLERLQQKMGKDEVLLTYYWGETQLYAVAIAKGDIHGWAIKADTNFLEAFNAFNQSIRTAPAIAAADIDQQAIAVQANGWMLYSKLLKPALDYMPSKSLITILPDGLLYHLSWYCISTEAISGTVDFRSIPYMMKKYQLRQEYSATLLFDDRPSKRTPYNYIGYAPAYDGTQMADNRAVDQLYIQHLYKEAYRSGYQALKYNVPEVMSAEQLFAKSKPFLGVAATEGQFKDWADQGKVLHLAMHALVNDDDPALSHLVFSEGEEVEEDGVLYAHEVYNLSLNADLTILSACNSGYGQLFEGQGVMSLARAFRYAGSKDVVMTLWPSHDQSSHDIIVDFFEAAQAQGLNKPQALQYAMNQHFEKENMRWMHPFYWAGFSFIGKGEPLVTNTMPHLWLYVVLTLSVLVLGVYWWRKKR